MESNILGNVVTLFFGSIGVTRTIAFVFPDMKMSNM